MKPLVPGASQLVLLLLLRARPATRKRRTSDKGYRIEGWEEWWRGGKKEWKTKGMREGRKGMGGKGRERGAIRDTEGVVETWRDLNNTLHLNASTDKRNGPATRNILLRAIIFSLANAPVAIVSLSRISCNPLSLFSRDENDDTICFKWFFRNELSSPLLSSFFSLFLLLVVGILSGDKRRFTVRGRIYERTEAVVAFFRILVAREYIRNGIKMEMFPAGTSPYSSRISTTSP